LDTERRQLIEGLCSSKPDRWGKNLREFYDTFVKQLEDLVREVGRQGGKASANSLSPAQRTERARKAGLARQAKLRAERGKSR
jgi:hypothetical protein